MENANLAQEIRRFIVDEYLFGRDEGLKDDSSFLQDGILDSTGILHLIAFLEETYGIKVEDDETIPDNLDSISNVAGYLRRKMNAAEAALVAGHSLGAAL